jgi:hypothetical protein
MSIHGKAWRAIQQHSRLAFFLVVGMLLLQQSDLEPGDKVAQVRAFTRQIEFDFITWTWDAMWVKLEQVGLGAVDYIPVNKHSQIVLDALKLNEKIWQVEGEINDVYANPEISDPKTASLALQTELDELYYQRTKLAPAAESIIQNQLSKIISDQGLPIGGQPFPPVLYHVTPLPRALVVSPRDTIRQDANIAIRPEITIDEQAALEADVDQTLDVSSLVVRIGGIGLYPTMVMETSNINWLAEVVSHEWTHNFLTLHPLGASYGASPELRIINETVANLVEKELGGALIETFYPEYIPPPPAPPDEGDENATAPDPPAFDFRAEMHETRVTTDELLAEGKIVEAETYMESRRQFLWQNGYRLRKLNQAYFAFYGAYADEPGGAAGATEDPIGDAVRKLRLQSPSLADFLIRISWMWTLEQLLDAVEAEENGSW